MSEFLGSRISLISKSDIRYVGTLHEINSDESTVSLENVCSFGTEGRRGRHEDEIAPSDQVYEYIVFRGSDVKDLRIEEHPNIKESKPQPPMPNDPAIVGARPRDSTPSQSLPSVATGFQHPYPPKNFCGKPPPSDSWGRGGIVAPMPGPGSGFGMPYPPHPHLFPQGQGFPPGCSDPWNNQGLPLGQGGPSGSDISGYRQGSQIPSKELNPGRTCHGSDRPSVATHSAQVAPVSEPKQTVQVPRQSVRAPSPPTESKPSAEKVQTVASTLSTNGSLSHTTNLSKSTPTAPRTHRVTPSLPLVGPNLKSLMPSTSEKITETNVRVNVATAPGSVEDTTNAARAAVAAAMAQLNDSAGNSMDNLTKKVNEMRVNANRDTVAGRGRGRDRRHEAHKVEVPESDFDFAQSNAKFNKKNIAKEAISGSPMTEKSNDFSPARINEAGLTAGNPAVAYNRSKSFFDNISSETKDRAENNGKKPGGREWRGEEQRKNMETFGQGSVDGGYRSYSGRGRGRGNRGRGYGRGDRGAGIRSQHRVASLDQ